MGQAASVSRTGYSMSFNLEDRVPTNHLLRRIDAVLDLSWLRAEAFAFLQSYGMPFDRSGADDPDAAGRLLLFDPFRASAVPGGRA